MAIGIRIVYLFQPIRYDEAYTFIMYASKPLYIGLSTYYLPNNHLLHTILVHFAYLIFGNHLWALRLPALLAGILIVPITYMMIRTIYNKNAAILAAALTAASSILIEFSTLARGYTLICLFFLLILYLGACLLKRDQSYLWYFFAFFSVLGFYTMPIMLYPFGIIIVWLILHYLPNHTNSYHVNLKNLIICIIVTAVASPLVYIPAVAVSGLNSIFHNVVRPKSLAHLFNDFPASLFLTWGQWNRDIPTVFIIALIIGVLTSFVSHGKISRYRFNIILPAVFFIVPILLIQRVVPYSRVWLFLLPLYLGAAAAGVSYLLNIIENRIRLRIDTSIVSIVLILIIGINIIHSKSILESDETGTMRNAESISYLLKNTLKNGNRVYAIPPADFPLIYYFNKQMIPIKFLCSNYESANRVLADANCIYAIVNGPGETLNDNLNKGKISLTDYESPILIKEFSHSKIFLLTRKSP